MRSGPSSTFDRPLLALGILVVTALWSVLSQVPFVHLGSWKAFFGPDGAISLLEEKTIDARLRWRGTIPSPLPLAYVDVDTLSIQRIGNFPWDRAIFARTLDALFRYGGVKAVGMDFVFSNAGLPSGGGGKPARWHLENPFMSIAMLFSPRLSERLEASRSSLKRVFPHLRYPRLPLRL